MRVGVIDGGFKDFSAHQGTDLPKSVTALCFNRISPGTTSDIATCETGSQHGSAVAEAIIDIAPDAELYISNPHTAADLQQAVQWMTDQGVDIINHSIGWGWDGPGDGTSPNSNNPLNAVDAGILWINAAGNHGHTSWMGPPEDQDNNRWMEFSGAEENHILLSRGDKVGIHLRWDDDWPSTSRELDLYLYDSSGNELRAATSAQNGLPGHKPRETLSYSISRSGTYSIKVKLNDGTRPDWVQMAVWKAAGSLSVNTGGSITNPAESANPGLISVGAANWADTDRIKHYSSQGPTPDGRSKPELVAADGGHSEVYNDIFDGNGRVISNLFINDPNNNDVGLFAGIGVKATIRNLGLQSASVTGRQDVGAIVGYNRAGNIRATYATGSVTGHDWVGGLVGDSIGRISHSYSQVLVPGEHKVGGLAGTNSYIIQSSYASGSVQGTHTVGGLTGRSRGKESQSYWDTETSGQSTSTAGTGQTTTELRAPTDYTGIYERWNPDSTDRWDFRSTTDYPALKADFDQDGTNTWNEFGNQ